MTSFVAVVASAAFLFYSFHSTGSYALDWQQYQARFVAPDGRVVDTGKHAISHSEGQGYGLLSAVHHDDRAAFKRIWQWTQQHLRVRDDRLFAWQWAPDRGVLDRNNASDGDVYIAWALLRAGEHWRSTAYLDEARQILADVKRKLIRDHAGYTVLLPGGEGFTATDHVVLNLSYWVFPALDAFARRDPDPLWTQLRDSGLRLLAAARFGEFGLPADWIALSATGAVTIADTFPKRFGFDAVRIPLFLYWAKEADRRLYDPYARFAARYPAPAVRPAWIDLVDGTGAAHPASTAFNTIIALAAQASAGTAAPVTPPQVEQTQDYYTASLILMLQQAASAQVQP